MPRGLTDKTALITGGASGNGREIAKRFADEGMQVVVADVTDEPRLGDQPTHESIREDGGDALFVETDVTSISDLEAAVETTVEEYGSLDVMVNNAGIFEAKPIGEVDEGEYDRMMDINLKGVYFGCQVAIERMQSQDDGGCIINLSSIAGLFAFDDSSVYCATKGGIATLSKELAVEQGPNGIRVNAINPGIIRTAMTTEDSGADDEMTDQIPLRRDGEPEEIASVAAFLASDDAAYVTGHNLVVDGGFTA